MFVTWVHRTPEGYDVPLACHQVNTRQLKTLHYVIRQQERPNVPDDEVPVEPTGRGRSRTPRNASPEILSSPVEFKDLDKMGPATMDLAHSPINPVDKVVWEPMKTLNQLDGVIVDFIMEDDPDDVPPSLNCPSSTGSRTPPPLCSPLLFRQLCTVLKKTSNDERQGNDAVGVQGGGADTDRVMVGGGGFGIQDDPRELTLFPDAGDLLNVSFFLEPEVLPVHSLALDSVVGMYAEDSFMHVGDSDCTVAMVDTLVRRPRASKRKVLERRCKACAHKGCSQRTENTKKKPVRGEARAHKGHLVETSGQWHLACRSRCHVSCGAMPASRVECDSILSFRSCLAAHPGSAGTPARSGHS